MKPGAVKGAKNMNDVKSDHALPLQEKWIKLSHDEVKHIFVYYVVIFFLSLAFCASFIYSGLPLDGGEIVLHRLMEFSFCFGLLGSTFYYIRKLYKSCIQCLIDSQHDIGFAGMGAKAYFYLRPVMGAVLAFLVIFGIYGGFFFLQDQPSINAGKFYIFSAIFYFLIGFSNGKIIVRLDNSTDKIAEMIQLTKVKENTK